MDISSDEHQGPHGPIVAAYQSKHLMLTPMQTINLKKFIVAIVFYTDKGAKTNKEVDSYFTINFQLFHTICYCLSTLDADSNKLGSKLKLSLSDPEICKVM